MNLRSMAALLSTPLRLEQAMKAKASMAHSVSAIWHHAYETEVPPQDGVRHYTPWEHCKVFQSGKALLASTWIVLATDRNSWGRCLLDDVEANSDPFPTLFCVLSASKPHARLPNSLPFIVFMYHATPPQMREQNDNRPSERLLRHVKTWARQLHNRCSSQDVDYLNSILQLHNWARGLPQGYETPFDNSNGTEIRVRRSITIQALCLSNDLKGLVDYLGPLSEERVRRLMRSLHVEGHIISHLFSTHGMAALDVPYVRTSYSLAICQLLMLTTAEAPSLMTIVEMAQYRCTIDVAVDHLGAAIERRTRQITPLLTPTVYIVARLADVK